MGKAKKGRRADKDDEIESDVEVEEQQNNEQAKSKTKGKDKKKKKGDEFDDLANEMSELKVEKSKPSKKEKKSKKGGDDSDDDMEILTKSKGKKSSLTIEDGDSDSETESSKANLKNRKNQAPKKGFAALSIDSGDDSDEDKSLKSKAKGKKGKKDVHYDSDDDEMEGQKQKGNKKNKKGKKQIDSDDSDLDVKKTKGKSKKGKKNVDSDSDGEEESIKSKAEEKKGKTKGKTKAKKASESDDDDFPIQPIKSTKGNKAMKGGFALLNVEGDDDNDDDDDIEEEPYESENESEKKPIVEKSKNSKSQHAQEQKKGKKAKKKRNDSEEDIEKVLAELEMEYSGQKKESVETVKVEEDEKKKIKENEQEKKIEKDEGNDEDDQEVSTVKSAAQKKKEKKERERLKKQAQKKADAVKKSEEPKKSDKPEEKEIVKPAKSGEKSDAEGEVAEEDDKKKKKKGAKEDPKDKGKGPGKKTILAMQEALKKAKEDEERLQREEEEKIRQEELREQARLEQIRLEQERKDKKKLKEKQRKERLKAEGKFLTPKQKQAQQRAQAMLEALRAQGKIPDATEKRPPRPGTRIKPSKMKSQISIEEADEKKDDENSTEVQVEIVDQQPKVEEIKKEDEVKDSWDADSSDEAEEDKSEEDPKSIEKGTSKEETPAKESSDSESETNSESGSDSEEESEDDSSQEDKMTDAERKKERARLRIETRRIEAEKKKNLDDLRAAVVCVLGHVDTGKTKILDKLRRTNVQDGEAGGITQQIGATNVPIDAIQDSTKHVKGFADKKIKIPGLLIIDTPGHESFSNLRNRGSSLCDIAVLVVDIMHGLEPQTIESINLLKTKKCPFVVALNKIDRLYDWNTMNRKDVQDIIKAQSINTQREFEKRYKDVIVQFAEQGLNAALFYENPDPRSYVSLVPTSAITGEGMGNLLALLVDACQGPLAKRLMYSEELQATVLEVKALPGLGTTIDCILVNGLLREGDTMIVAGTDGPIVTQIRSLLMPQPLKELRVKNAYQEYREIKAAQGVKIAAKDLEKAIAGLNLLVAQKPDEVDVLRDEIAQELTHVLGNIKLAERGVFVQASTLGALEALLDFLKSSKIPYAGIRIGPVVKKDVMKASIMLEHDSQYATILAFDVKIERDAQELADSIGVKIFQADIIYHLFDKFTAYREELKQRKREEHKHIAVFPCKLKILPQFLFKTRDPIVAGVMVEAGILKPGTPVCVPSKEFVDLGVVTSVEINHKPVEFARKGQEVCIKIEPVPGEAPKMFGRHFDEKDMIISKISRQSIDACKDYFREDLVKTDWQLMVELKKLFQIL
ncbi:eukaryotic translation initiation factor 5B [Leptopilina boulardi]|uniref:eukaryotic translation initiation factor 5B n=1 Tax=Leptopilina boulardi TaxID=63433 RepID=UPI0021F5ECDE|nr:eukaryotic translation initiation factor 5B [Leptopilina boulardi]